VRAPASARGPRREARRPRPEKPNGLPPQRRLLRSADFSRVERQGQRAQGALLVVIGRQGRGRVGFTVSKKVGNAVERNHVKRRLRDIARRHKERWAGRDVVIIAKPEAAGRSLAELEADLLAVFAKLDASRLQAPRAPPPHRRTSDGETRSRPTPSPRKRP
jgi:ribonuclease P protein component